MTPPLDAIRDFALLFLALYAVNLASYFGIGYAVTRLNARNPERRIQKNRSGEKRKREEIRQSVKSIAVIALSLTIGIFAQWRGWAPTPFEITWWNAAPLLVLAMVGFEIWFYAAHRLLHTKRFYRFHLMHHRSVAPTVWSSDSIGLVDTAISQGFYVVAPFVFPFPAAILVLNRLIDHTNGILGHAGYEYFASSTARHPWPMLSSTYHDLHHSEFRWNFGNYVSVFDRLFGTIHPGYDSRVREIEATQPPLALRAARDPADRSESVRP
ncbi:MAG TPA: sterol desaturase family protein [Methylomirabilota bacterium]|nr:sterol desaturase family protein [Methylomirabilota bacterium]